MDETLEMQQDYAARSADADAEQVRRGYALADYECRHGKMPHDRTQTCECFTKGAHNERRISQARFQDHSRLFA